MQTPSFNNAIICKSLKVWGRIYRGSLTEKEGHSISGILPTLEKEMSKSRSSG
jgi:hypothetical protein